MMTAGSTKPTTVRPGICVPLGAFSLAFLLSGTALGQVLAENLTSPNAPDNILNQQLLQGSPAALPPARTDGRGTAGVGVDTVISGQTQVYAIPGGYTFDLSSNTDLKLGGTLPIATTTRLGSTNSQTGIGDISVSGILGLGKTTPHRTLLNLYLKLPTGDAAAGIGSDTTEVYLGATHLFHVNLGLPMVFGGHLGWRHSDVTASQGDFSVVDGNALDLFGVADAELKMLLVGLHVDVQYLIANAFVPNADSFQTHTLAFGTSYQLGGMLDGSNLYFNVLVPLNEPNTIPRDTAFNLGLRATY